MFSEREYNSFVKEYSRNIFRYVFKSIHDKEASNDIVQECFIKLWEHRKNVAAEKVKYWLFSTAHNTMINYVNRSSRTVSINRCGFIEPFFESQDFALKELIDKSLELLPQLQKTILLLRDLEGYNYEEIGEILNLSASQVKVYLFRARQKMKNSLKELSKVL